ncbi:MAG: hypothetical protein LC620_05590, partial [Halobacteriales archaeon]|nr:hypothetical protein [Halobacteriales archaeon]
MATVLALPECRARLPIEALDGRQRAELVRLLAEKGPAALEAWLREEGRHDPSIRRRLERHRARLERSARAERERMADGAAGRARNAQSAWEVRAADQVRREEELRQRIARAAGVPVLSLDDMLQVEPGGGTTSTRRGGGFRAFWRRLSGRIILF